MKKFIPIAVAAAIISLGGCASGMKHSEADASAAIAAAVSEEKRASKIGNQWRDTGKMIKKAKKALKDGKYDEAVKIANKAKKQSTNAIAQAESQKDAGPNY